MIVHTIAAFKFTDRSPHQILFCITIIIISSVVPHRQAAQCEDQNDPQNESKYLQLNRQTGVRAEQEEKEGQEGMYATMRYIRETGLNLDKN